MSKKKRLFWHIYPSYFLITFLSLLTVTWYASKSFREFYLERTASDLEVRALFFEKQIIKQLTHPPPNQIDSICKELGKKTSTRITVILASGKVIGDSRENPEDMDNHASRPEVKIALSGQTNNSIRFSQTLRENMMYLAIPLKNHNKIIGILRTSIPITSIDLALKTIYIKIILGGLITAFFAAVISLIVSRRISLPLEEMKLGADRFANGDLGHRLPVPDLHEIGGLAEAMNHMATQLSERIHTIVRQRGEQETILSCMVEGVLAVDTEEHIISLNIAAARLIGTTPVEAQGRSLQEIVRNSELQRFVLLSLSSHAPVEREIVFYGKNDLFLQAHGTVLCDEKGIVHGALIVLNNVTSLRRLENIRRDFVTNASHELKTPITVIKGFLETLLNGAMNKPDKRVQFLEIIAKQANRLNAIIEDILTLARVEQDDTKSEIILEKSKIKPVLKMAIELCEVKALSKNIKIDLICPDETTARINPSLFEQAVSNLIDNAVKYSNPGGMVHVKFVEKDTEIMITVQDNGIGIPADHLPRLFERFYRVDKSRSRNLGGTGLGLAIVKHIIQVHGGHIRVSSSLNEGSLFSIHLPIVLNSTLLDS